MSGVLEGFPVTSNICTFWSTVHDKHHVTILTHYSLLYILIFNHTLKYQCEFIVVFVQWLPNIVYWTSGFDLFVCASTDIIWAASTKSSSRNHHDVSGILLHTESIILHVFNMLSKYVALTFPSIKNIFSSHYAFWAWTNNFIYLLYVPYFIPLLSFYHCD